MPEGFKIPEKLKKWLDMKMILIMGIVGKMAWDMFTTGAEVKYQIHFQETLKTDGAKNIIHTQIVDEMDNALEDKNFLAKAFSSDGIIAEIDKQISIAKKHIVDEVIVADSTKIDFIGAVAIDSDLRDEKIIPAIAMLVKAYENGDILLKDDVEEYIKEEVKKRMRTVRADF